MIDAEMPTVPTETLREAWDKWQEYQKRKQQMQSTAGTHHGDAVEGTSTDPVDLKVQQYRECLDLVKQVRKHTQALKDHLVTVGLYRPETPDTFSGPSPYHLDHVEILLGMQEDNIVRAAYNHRGTI